MYVYTGGTYSFARIVYARRRRGRRGEKREKGRGKHMAYTQRRALICEYRYGAICDSLYIRSVPE